MCLNNQFDLFLYTVQVSPIKLAGHKSVGGVPLTNQTSVLGREIDVSVTLVNQTLGTVDHHLDDFDLGVDFGFDFDKVVDNGVDFVEVIDNGVDFVEVIDNGTMLLSTLEDESGRSDSAAS